MDRMFVGMRTIPLEQGGKYTAAYYILMEEGNSRMEVCAITMGCRWYCIALQGKGAPVCGGSLASQIPSIGWYRE